MARGRKRKPDADRQPNGDIRQRPSRDNPYLYRRRLDGFGIKGVEQYDDKEVVRVTRAKGLHIDSHEHPLRVLCVLGHISGTQRDKGEEFGDLYWRLFGAPNARAADLHSAGGGQGHTDPIAQMVDERRYADCLKALDASGARQYVVELAVYLAPGWLIPDLVAQGRSSIVRGGRHDRRLRLIVRGLDALEDVPRPRLSDAERENALREVA